MKKYLSIAAMIAIANFAIFSCNKAVEPESNLNQMPNSSNETEVKIRSFLDRMQSELKDGGTYSIDDAIWYVEAALNYSYAIYDSEFVYLLRDSSFFSIDLNQNNTVNESDLINAYDNMVDSLEAQYDGIPSLTKHVFICDVIDVSNSMGHLDLKLLSVIATGYAYNPYGSFGSTDYWRAGYDLGKCNGYSGDGDATIQLEQKLLHPCIASVSGKRIYWEDVVMDEVKGWAYPYTPSPRGFRGYFYESHNGNDVTQCLPPDELNFYISNNGIPYIINDLNIYENHEFCDIDVLIDGASGTNYFYELHFFRISYGIKQETINAIIPL